MQAKVYSASLVGLEAAPIEVEVDKLSADGLGESSEVVQGRVQKARDIQTDRFRDLAGIKTNSEMSIREIREYCKLGDAEQGFMKSAVVKMYLSARSYHRILKLARTIADLEDCTNIQINHLAEALQYRPKVE